MSRGLGVDLPDIFERGPSICNTPTTESRFEDMYTWLTEETSSARQGGMLTWLFDFISSLQSMMREDGGW